MILQQNVSTKYKCQSGIESFGHKKQQHRIKA